MNHLNKFVSGFCNLKLDNIYPIRKQYFQVNDLLKSTLDKVDKKPFCAGVFLGEEKGDKFNPSCALLDMIANNTDKKVYVNEKSAWMFLCGRDIMAEGINSGHEKKVKELVLIQNENDENLGYGKIIAPLNSPKQRVVIKNILDKGSFLRREH